MWPKSNSSTSAMPKPLVNNKIIYPNLFGRIAQHELFLNQGVRAGDSPTFANLQLTGDATIEGNLYVQGNTTVLNTNIIEFEDNIITINRLETGAGVTLNLSGFEIERGSEENYRIVYNELDKNLRIGVISNTQAVATRQDSPLDNGVMIWNNTSKRLDSRTSIDLDLTFSSTTDSFSNSTGSLKLAGGIGITKNAHVGGRLSLVGSNNSNKTELWSDPITSYFYMSSPSDIYITPSTKIRLPYDRPVTFGADTQSISANSLTKDINVNADGHVNFTVPFGKRINVPNQIPITFATQNEKIYTDSSNNMVVTGSQDIILTPGPSKKVLLLQDIPLSFANASQYISGNVANDLNIVAGNNIYISPGSTMNIVIPTDAGIKLGNIGTQRITANSSSELSILASSDIKLSSGTTVRIPVNIPLTFGTNNTEKITSDISNNLSIIASNLIRTSQLKVLDTRNSVSISSGALVVDGGTGISKDLNVGGNVVVAGNLTVSGTTTTVDTQTVLVKDNILVLNSAPFPSADGGLLVKRGPVDVGSVYAGLFYKESTDEYTFAYTSTDPGSSSVVIDNYIPLRARKLILTSTDDDSVNVSSGALISNGGGYFGKSLVVAGYGMTVGSLFVTGGNLITPNLHATNSTTSNLFVTDKAIFSSTSPNAVDIYGGLTAFVDATINGVLYIANTSLSTSLSTGSLKTLGGVSIVCSQNSASATSGGALTVAGGASVAGDVYIGGQLYGVDNTTLTKLRLISTEPSTDVSTGALISLGGICIASTSNSVHSSNGGALTIAGGAAISKDLIVGGDLFCDSSLHVNDTSFFEADASFTERVLYQGNGMLTSVHNTTGSSLWTALGTLNDSNLQLKLVSDDCFLTVSIQISDTTCSAYHKYSGSKVVCTAHVYKDNTDAFQLFIKSDSDSQVGVHVMNNTGSQLVPIYNSVPNGLWTEIWSTTMPSTMTVQSGDTTIHGTTNIVHNFPRIGFNNTNVNVSRNVGVLLQRFNHPNDNALGNVVNEPPTFTYTIPSQSAIPANAIKLGNVANSSDDYYTGWWISVGTQVRYITAYNGAQRVATLSTPWTNAPSNGDSANLFNKHFVTSYFDETDKKVHISYATVLNNTEISRQDWADVSLNNLIVNSTRPASNSSSGSLLTFGGISINNTIDSSNCTSGGCLTVRGGGAFDKSLFVGNAVNIGRSSSGSSSLNIVQPSSTMSFVNGTSGVSYIDFSNTTATKHFGIVFDNNVFSLTNSNSNSTPDVSFKALSVTTSGNLGIHTTTNVHSPLVLLANNFISTNSKNGYLGLVGGNSNNNDTNAGGRIVLFGNNHSTNPGDVQISSGTTGSITLTTNVDTDMLTINSSGSVHVWSTTLSKNGSSGSLVVSGGIGIKCTENSESSSNGGSLTVGGGGSFSKDLFIGGNLYISGSITSDGSVLTPSFAFSNTDGCSIVGYTNNKLLSVSTEAIFSFSVWVTPSAASRNCEFQFSLPYRINGFFNRGDFISSCTGWTDDDNVIPLFNVLSVGVKGAARGLVKFQSVSTATHYFSIMCRYTMA